MALVCPITRSQFGCAISMGEIETVETALKYHPEWVMGANDLGSNNLHYAAGSGHTEIVDILLRFGPIFLVKTQNGLTPLHWASRGGNDLLVDLLLRSRELWPLTFTDDPVIDIPDNMGRPAILHAAEQNHQSTVELLLQWGSQSFDLWNEDGQCLLHWAIQHECETIVEMLLRYGTQHLDAPDRGGRTPLQLAMDGGNQSLVTILRAAGAQHDSISEPMDDGTILETRYRIYFSWSLLSAILRFL